MLREIAKSISDVAAADVLEQYAVELIAKAEAILKIVTKPPTDET